MLEAIGFTAARDLDVLGMQVIENVLLSIPAARRYVTGGASGGGAYIGPWLREHRPWAEHMVVVPWNRSQADPWWEAYGSSVILMQMEPGSTYKDRNATIVLHSSAVFGFPAFPEADERSRRSGTWQTIRIARQMGRLHRWDCVQPPYEWKVEQPVPAWLTQHEEGRAT